MSEILLMAEREEIIDSLQNWIELRESRNALEHDYPDELALALQDLKDCIHSFTRLEQYYLKSLEYARRVLHAPF